MRYALFVFVGAMLAHTALSAPAPSFGIDMPWDYYVANLPALADAIAIVAKPNPSYNPEADPKTDPGCPKLMSVYHVEKWLTRKGATNAVAFWNRNRCVDDPTPEQMAAVKALIGPDANVWKCDAETAREYLARVKKWTQWYEPMPGDDPE